jgi:cell division protein FtsI/penicillin-binding protein 2
MALRKDAALELYTVSGKTGTAENRVRAGINLTKFFNLVGFLPVRIA